MPTLSKTDKKKYLDRALKAADWFVNAQIAHPKPWYGDLYRFPYYYNFKEKKKVPGLNWTHGRALFVLTEAYHITQDDKYLNSINLGLRFVRALQPLNPFEPLTHGTFREELPQAPRGGILDGAQAASGMLMVHEATGCEDGLRRGRAFCDFLKRTHCPQYGLVSVVEYYPERIKYFDQGWQYTMHHCSAIPIWHYYRLTGDRSHLSVLLDVADRALKSQRDEGCFNYLDSFPPAAPKTHPNHHEGYGKGDEIKIIRNDDGLVTLILAAYKASGDQTYLDSMVRYAEWIVKNEPHERPYNAFGIQASNVYDIGKVAGKDWTPWILDNLQARCLDLQMLDSGDKDADGGFRGEDEEGGGGIWGGDSLDYIPTRNTCYMTGLLFRLSGQGRGSGFSVFGLKD